MGSQNKCTCSRILTILTLCGGVSSFLPQGMPQGSTLLSEKIVCEGKISPTLYIFNGLSERFIYMLLQWIASGCVPCRSDATAEFGRKFLARVHFALNLSFEQVWFLIPGNGSKSRFYRICRATSSNFVGSTQHPWQEKYLPFMFHAEKIAADNRAWK